MTNGCASGQYIQAGYGRHQGESNIYPFAEYRGVVGGVTHHGFKELTTAVTGTHRYMTSYLFSTGHFWAYMDSSSILGTDFDPAVYWCGPWGIQYEAEVHDGGDDVPGSSANAAHFSTLRYKDRSSNWYTPTGLTVSSDSTRYGWAWDANPNFHVWTK